jgi:dTMP kinase
MLNYDGFFITIEGIDGSGKTSLANSIRKALEDKKIDVVLTKEPGGSIFGKELRETLQTKKTPIIPKAEFLLFAADRAQHFSQVIIPALKKGDIVISDRCADSSVAYQGYGRNVDVEKIASVNKWVMQGIQPNITFYLKIDLKTALERIKESRSNLTSFEKESEVFWRDVIEGYKKIFTVRSNIYELDAKDEKSVILEKAMAILSEKISA